METIYNKVVKARITSNLECYSALATYLFYTEPNITHNHISNMKILLNDADDV